jgi:type IV pilus assembly protein PilW
MMVPPNCIELRSRRQERGTSLVEIMIALTIGLVLLAGLAELFANNSRTRGEIDKASKQVENGRYAVEVLRNEIRMAGFFGGYDDSAATPQPTAACVPASGIGLSAVNLGWQSSPATVPLGVHGYAGGDTPAAESCITRQKANTDVLVVRRLESVAQTVASVVGASAANDYYMQVSHCSDSTVDPPSVPFVVASGASATPFVLHEKNCITPALLRKLVVRVFYVGLCSDCSGAGDGIPTLRMIELAGGNLVNLPVAEGIDALRLEYGIDNDNDGTVDALKRCKTGTDACTTADWRNAMAVQVRLLSRNIAASPDYVDQKTYDMGLAGSILPLNDHYKRHAYSTSVIVYNHTGPREQ